METEQTERVECPLADEIDTCNRLEIRPSDETSEKWAREVRALATENADLRARLAEADEMIAHLEYDLGQAETALESLGSDYKPTIRDAIAAAEAAQGETPEPPIGVGAVIMYEGEELTVAEEVPNGIRALRKTSPPDGGVMIGDTEINEMVRVIRAAPEEDPP